MDGIESLKRAEGIMLDFARITGLEPTSTRPKRYLWTDAFAVCNFLELYDRTTNDRYLDLATRLIDQVHHTLGQHREDDARKGWISGLDQAEGEKHPTVGGLRIGKKLNERKRNEPADPVLEWEQDGQYYHYLTKWMHALERAARITKDKDYLRWAVELAKKVEAAFAYDSSLPGLKRLYWKMSIDLSYPLVQSMGQHDPLDGFVTYNELQLASKSMLDDRSFDLSEEIEDIAKICQGGSWITDDPLGIGGLMFDSSRIGQLVSGGLDYSDLLQTVLDSSSLSMSYLSRADLLELPASYRLAFRELGLSIGLRGIEKLNGIVEEKSSSFKHIKVTRRELNDLMKHLPVAERIERFWTDPRNHDIKTWVEHQEINMVMLATSLAPNEFLSI